MQKLKEYGCECHIEFVGDLCVEVEVARFRPRQEGPGVGGPVLSELEGDERVVGLDPSDAAGAAGTAELSHGGRCQRQRRQRHWLPKEWQMHSFRYAVRSLIHA